MTEKDTPMRPVIRYYGSKWRLAPWIIDHFPEHTHYVELCGGAASVLLRKPRSTVETYNDLDCEVVNLFRVLRDHPRELIRKIRLTPWSRVEYDQSIIECQDDIERARRFIVRLTMGINGGSAQDAMYWRVNKGDKSGRSASDDLIIEENLEKVSSRFRRVQIENDDYRNIIERYDRENTLFYHDPPYVKVKRTRQNGYSLEWEDQDHIESSHILSQCKGYVVISGYHCPLYTDLYERNGWTRIDRETTANQGIKRTESLWLSPRTFDDLQKVQQLSLL